MIYVRNGVATFFEVVLARILQELGASLVYEAANPDGKRPDFRAQFADVSVIIEGVSTRFKGAVGDKVNHQVPLLNLIESYVPEGWRVFVWGLPDIGPSDSRKSFALAVRQMLDVPPPTQNDTARELIRELPTGIIHLQLFPTSADDKRLGCEAPISLIDNSKERICHAVKSKRKQVRHSQMPVLLAIQASGICSKFEDFDEALFGGECSRYDERHRFVGTEFLPNGIFNYTMLESSHICWCLSLLVCGLSGLC